MEDINEIQIPPTNTFFEKDRLLYLTSYTMTTFIDSFDLGGIVADLPFWSIPMTIGAFCDNPVEIAEGMFAFIDEDDNLMAIDMPTPAQNGAPSEAILSVLRDWISEDEITDIMENVQFTQTGPLAGLLSPSNGSHSQ
jgi:hypothetical protein